MLKKYFAQIKTYFCPDVSVRILPKFEKVLKLNPLPNVLRKLLSLVLFKWSAGICLLTFHVGDILSEFLWQNMKKPGHPQAW
jgi:hypothetical protein